MAKEWACADGNNGYANKYKLNTEGLYILYLNCEEYHILNWLSILLDNRTFNISEGISCRAKEYLMQHFLTDYKTLKKNAMAEEGTYVMDIIRAKWNNDDIFRGNPHYLVGYSGKELADIVLADKKPAYAVSQTYSITPEYWAG